MREQLCVNEWTLKPTEVGLVSRERGKEMSEGHRRDPVALSTHPSSTNPSPRATLSFSSSYSKATQASERKKETDPGSVFDHKTFKQCNLRCTTSLHRFFFH